MRNLIRKMLKEQLNPIKWIKPDFNKEEGEFSGHFLHWLEDDVLQLNFNDYSKKWFNQLWDMIVISYNDADVEPLNDEEWSKMENTDSWGIESEEDLYNIIHGQWGRDKERIKKYSIDPIKMGGIVDTPIVVYVDGHPPYLVAGNTRLSACKILGITPMVTKVYI